MSEERAADVLAVAAALAALDGDAPVIDGGEVDADTWADVQARHLGIRDRGR